MGWEGLSVLFPGCHPFLKFCLLTLRPQGQPRACGRLRLGSVCGRGHTGSHFLASRAPLPRQSAPRKGPWPAHSGGGHGGGSHLLPRQSLPIPSSDLSGIVSSSTYWVASICLSTGVITTSSFIIRSCRWAFHPRVTQACCHCYHRCCYYYHDALGKIALREWARLRMEPPGRAQLCCSLS